MNTTQISKKVNSKTAKQNYSPFHTFVQKFASTKPGAWYLSRTQHYFDRVIFKLTRGRTTLTSILTGMPVVILTSIGAKSGLPRTCHYYVSATSTTQMHLLLLRQSGDRRTIRPGILI